MLGDGHIVKRSPSGNSRLVYAQTSVTHKEYFNYVYNFFKPLCVAIRSMAPQASVIISPSLEQLRTIGLKKTYSAISFTTMQLPCFNVYREMFYLFKVKKVPEFIYEALTSRGLAF